MDYSHSLALLQIMALGGKNLVYKFINFSSLLQNEPEVKGALLDPQETGFRCGPLQASKNLHPSEEL